VRVHNPTASKAAKAAVPKAPQFSTYSPLANAWRFALVGCASSCQPNERQLWSKLHSSRYVRFWALSADPAFSIGIEFQEQTGSFAVAKAESG
jgi:hypothetical protein